MRRSWRTVASALSVGVLLSMGAASHAASITQDFTFENDGDVTDAPFGTVVIDEVAANQLKFTITINSKLGPSPDIHQFGFMLDFAAVTLVAGGDALSLGTGGSISGANRNFDYVADFGNGGAVKLNPAMFTITGVGLDLSAIFDAGTATQNDKPDAQFMVHVQNTGGFGASNGVGSSEALGGSYVPIPGAVWMFGSGLVALLSFTRRKRLAKA